MLVPNLRFPEFMEAGAWKDIPIDSILEVRDERRVPSAEAPLYSLTIESGITEKTDRYNREFLVRDAGRKKYKLVEPQDIVYNPSNLRWGAINYSQVSHSVVVSPIYEVLNLPKDLEHSLEFIACSVMRGEQIKRFITKAQGTLVERIAVKIEDFLSTNLAVPPSHAEQQKIAECLSSVDELMAAQARKVEALKAHKKGLMQQLFPREGETQPRLRFPEFQNAGEWEESELGRKTNKVGSGITPTGGDKNYKQSGRPFVRSQNVGWGVLLLDDVAYIDEETHASFDSTEIKVRDVLLNITGASIGRSSVADNRIAGGNVNQHVCIIRTKPDELSHLFLNQFLISERGQKQIDSFQAGGNRQGLNFAQIRSFAIPLPPNPLEQQHIAECLSSLDAQITAETQKLEALKTHKKGLMQQLFPSPEVTA